jgi:Flp pilus assembly CpaE family ATPase
MTDAPPVRIALGLGDQELEQRLRPALDADAEVQGTVHCLAADQVLQAVQAREVDAVVLGWGLHRLTDALVTQLEHAHLPLVLLKPQDRPAVDHASRTVVVPPEVEPPVLRQALQAAVRGTRPQPERPKPNVERPAAPPVTPALFPLTIIAVTGGGGSPGRTTLAVNLATALGTVASTALVDLDLSNPSVSAFLNRDPSRNVCTLAHAVRDMPSTWTAALAQELQPLHQSSPRGSVLCGLPKRELRAGVTPTFVERLLAELGQAHRYVVVDVGAELLGLEPLASGHRAAIAAAQHVFVVTGPDVISLWHTRSLLHQLERDLGVEHERLSLVPNRHDSRYHHGRGEIEWHLGVPAAAVVPHDYGPVQRAVAEQRPVVTDPSSRAGRAIVGLAERIHEGRVRMLPHEAGAARGRESRIVRGLAGLAARLSPTRSQHKP